MSVFDESGADRKLTTRAFDLYRSRQKRTHIEKVMSRSNYFSKTLPHVIDRHLFHYMRHPQTFEFFTSLPGAPRIGVPAIVKIDGDRLHGVRFLKNNSMSSLLFRYVSVFDETGTDRKLTMRAFDRYRSHQKRTHIEKL